MSRARPDRAPVQPEAQDDAGRECPGAAHRDRRVARVGEHEVQNDGPARHVVGRSDPVRLAGWLDPPWSSSRPGTSSKKPKSGSISCMDAFTVVFGGTLAFFVVLVLLLGMFSKRSALDILDWKPTRSPEAEAQNEVDDIAQMIEAQNELKRRRGAPQISEEEIEARVREDREQLRRWRES